MAGVWSGFTEEDIGFYQRKSEGKNEKIKTPKNKMENGKSLSKEISTKNKTDSKNVEDIPESAKLFNETKDTDSQIEKKEETVSSSAGTVTSSNPVCIRVLEGKAYELIDKNCVDASKATLEIFETRQKMLEEQNRRRKEMLSKVISARKKQTTEEAKRLQHIQEELQKLDILLSNDVGILRNKIEEASLDFVEAQKRYKKAEKEFLDAKQSLLGKSEKKELLTKLLCTIIEQNEMRKAQKLSELMEKLKINENGGDFSLVAINSENSSALKETNKTSEVLNTIDAKTTS